MYNKLNLNMIDEKLLDVKVSTTWGAQVWEDLEAEKL